MHRLTVVLSVLALVAGCSDSSATPGATASRESAVEPAAEAAVGGRDPRTIRGPETPVVDAYRPDGKTARPALGGRVILHFSNEPPSLNFMNENSGVTHWVLDECHAGILKFNKETWTFEPDLATEIYEEDLVILKGGIGEGLENVLYGEVTEEGDEVVVRSGSPHNTTSETRVARGDVQSIERGTVHTFELRTDALWHDGHPFDAHDAYFTWQAFHNPGVDCDEKRYKYTPLFHAEVVDDHTIRFFRDEQYFQAMEAFVMDFCILPSHLYNLRDPDNADHDATASLERQAEFINDNPHNFDWVGLGPYRVTEWERGQQIKARKFDGYWEKDPAKSGYLDEMWWRIVDDDNAAFQALLAGELDVFFRVKTEDFKGALTQGPEFTENFYKTYTYVGNLNFTCWNTQQPHLSDMRVRQALAYGYDIPGWIHTKYHNLAMRMTGASFPFGPQYNRDVEPTPYDPERAKELLAEAGWYDRDGDGVVDKAGRSLTIEVLMPSGNKASESTLQYMQGQFEKIGVKVEIVSLEWAQLLEKTLERNFDSVSMAWVLNSYESDPYQLWHGSQANIRSSNRAAVDDDIVDELIEKGRRELDDETRYAIWMDLHERLYELQPYIFSMCVPRKIAINKDLYGVKLYNFEPGFRLRDMYYAEGTPGTRPLSPN